MPVMSLEVSTLQIQPDILNFKIFILICQLFEDDDNELELLCSVDSKSIKI